MTTNQNEIVFYILVRTDLELTPGKLASQAGHAVHLTLKAVQEHPSAPGTSDPVRVWAQIWEQNSYPKITLAVKNEAALGKHVELARGLGVEAVRVVDEGRTQIAGGTVTCAGIGPVPRGFVESLSRLRLLP